MSSTQKKNGIVRTCLLTGPTNPKDVDPRYMVPIIDHLFCYLPKSFRKIFWCGVDRDGIAEDKERSDVTKDEVVGLGTIASIKTPQFGRQIYTDNRREGEMLYNYRFTTVIIVRNALNSR